MLRPRSEDSDVQRKNLRTAPKPGSHQHEHYLMTYLYSKKPTQPTLLRKHHTHKLLPCHGPQPVTNKAAATSPKHKCKAVTLPD